MCAKQSENHVPVVGHPLSKKKKRKGYATTQIVPEHVERTAVTTPDGNMYSTVIQIGDCNAPATYHDAILQKKVLYIWGKPTASTRTTGTI